MDNELITHSHSQDGVDNSENVLDMQKQLTMLLENIKDNTDVAFSILKMHEEDGDQEIVDVYRINCSNILDCEKLATEKAKEFRQMFDKLSSSKDALSCKQDMEEIFEQICQFEKSSESYLQTLLSLISQ